jgi:hypothetical protein
MAIEGVSIAFDHDMFEPTPTWTRIDTACRVSRIEIKRGRQDEFADVPAGEATVFVNDVDGLFDPSNAGSPYFDKLDSRQCAIAIRNPVTDVWSTLFRGVIDDYGYDLHPSQLKTETAVKLVDGLDYFANVEIAPGLFGSAAPAVSEGYVFYDNGPVDDRIIQAIADTEWLAAMTRIFSGNIQVQESLYSPGEAILSVIDEAVEAEFPGVALRFVDRDGIFVFHGRLARFKPEVVQYDIDTWRCGDGAAILADPTRAQIRPPFTFQRPRANIINAYLSYPKGIAAADMAAQIVTDAASIAAHGTRSRSAPDLIILSSDLTGNDGNAECQLYGTYYVTNYAQAQTRINGLTFRSLRPDDDRAAATWDLICGVEITDLIDVDISHPGGGGIADEFFVEGIRYELEPLVGDLDTGYPDVTLTLDVSPRAYWATNVFE